MKTSTRISEMRKFHFGRKIVCSDGEAGSLANIEAEDQVPGKYIRHTQ